MSPTPLPKGILLSLSKDIPPVLFPALQAICVLLSNGVWWVIEVYEYKIFVRVVVTCEGIAANAESDAELDAQNKS